MTQRILLGFAGSLVAIAAQAAFPTIGLQPVSQGSLVSPVGITNAGDTSNRLFVTDQRGTIHVIQNGSLLATPFLDIESRLVPERQNFDERGLLGLAFHPAFGKPGAVGSDKFYVYYSAPSSDPGTANNPIDHQSVIAEYSVTSIGSNTADPNSERILMTFNQPQFNHDAGFVGFGPDGMLYITTGDGGGGGDDDPGHTGGGDGDPLGGLGNSQDRSNLLGKVLRIDVDGTNGPGGQYGIPADNPFIGVAGVHEEIYAYGLRNPWRASFDGDRFFVADVGQGDVEEINLIVAGGNYGWRVKEGTFDFDPSVSPDPAVPLIDPIGQYAHPGSANGLPELGISVTGGVVYRGADFPELDGKYIFGDFSTQFAPANGRLLGLEETSPGVFDLSTLSVQGGNPIGEYILAFGLDESGEAYVATKTALSASGLDPNTNLPTGSIYRITVVPEPSSCGIVGVAILIMGSLTRANSSSARKHIGRAKIMTTLHRTPLLAVAVAVWVVPTIVWADPMDQHVFENFESIDTTMGESFDIGTGDTTATFSGDAFSGVIGVFQLYHSGTHSWMVNAPGAGTVTFSTNAAVVEFFARSRSSADGDTVITAFDDDNQLIGVPVTLSPPDPFQLVSFSGSIDRIVFENLATGGSQMFNGIDDFGFTPVAVVAGDFDGDGDVDGDDFLIWQSNFGSGAGGDADGDGDTDGDDFLIWQSNFDRPASSESPTAGIPEPGTTGLCVLTFCPLLIQRSRARCRVRD